MLNSTNYIIYLLVRDISDKDAYLRVKNKYKYYFNTDIGNYKSRLIVLASDIEKPNLGLSDDMYEDLGYIIDSIIHAAALVKHYGNYDIFYSANVQATTNLLELARFNTIKDFHYILTLSIFTDGYIPNCSYYIFDEEDNNDILVGKNNIYIKTKYEGELITIKYRDFGLKTSIYRVGNLCMHSQNYKIQEKTNYILSMLGFRWPKVYQCYDF